MAVSTIVVVVRKMQPQPGARASRPLLTTILVTLSRDSAIVAALRMNCLTASRRRLFDDSSLRLLSSARRAIHVWDDELTLVNQCLLYVSPSGLNQLAAFSPVVDTG